MEKLPAVKPEQDAETLRGTAASNGDFSKGWIRKAATFILLKSSHLIQYCTGEV